MKNFKRLYESTERLVQDVNIVNNETLEYVTGALKRVIKKWKSGRQLSNGALFIPVFSLESKEEKYKEIVKQKWAKDYVKFERPDSDELPFTYLSVTILAIDYFAAEKARKKGLDNEYVRTLRNQIDEYHAINKELEDDLNSIRGLVLSGYGLGKKRKGKQFDTSSYLFYIDPELIDINELSKHFITSNDRYDSVKKRLAKECFFKDKNGYFVYDGVPYGTYKTRRMDLDIDEKLKMTNIKRENKVLYNKIINNVAKEVKRALLEYDVTMTGSGDVYNNETSSEDFYDQSEVRFQDIYYDGMYHPTDNETLCELVRNLMLEDDIMDLNCIDVSKITDFSYVFADNSGLPWIDIDKWDVSNGVNFEGMFMDCPHFNADLSKWNVSNGINFRNMFFNCSSFNSDLRNWWMGNAVDVSNMFCDCSSLNCELRNWNLPKVKEVKGMFNGCDSLKMLPQWYSWLRRKLEQW